MSSDLRTKLSSERTTTTWRDLDASGHASALLVVDPHLDLVTAGVALGENDVASVKRWLGAGQLRKAGAPDLDTWRAAPDTIFEMLIVQPFVLVQPVVARA